MLSTRKKKGSAAPSCLLTHTRTSSSHNHPCTAHLNDLSANLLVPPLARRRSGSARHSWVQHAKRCQAGGQAACSRGCRCLCGLLRFIITPLQGALHRFRCCFCCLCCLLGYRSLGAAGRVCASAQLQVLRCWVRLLLCCWPCILPLHIQSPASKEAATRASICF